MFSTLLAARRWRRPTLRSRLRRFLAAFVLLGAGTAPTGILAQDADWSFGTDPFADLWFHGLAIVGFDGFGRVPLYDAEYAWAVASARGSGEATSPLVERRGQLLAAFLSDPSYEVLHFVPLYLADAPVGVALDALEHLGDADAGALDARVAREARALAAILSPAQHEVVSNFVTALQPERPVLRGQQRLDLGNADLAGVWSREVAGPLASFLHEEGFHRGRVIVTPALGAEGRFLATESGPLIMVGARTGSEPRGVVGAVVRELCYPAVRRALAPYESRFDDRAVVSDVSDLAATRCGERLLEERAPALLDAYRARFGVSASGAGFLSAAGLAPGVAVLEDELDRALEHELKLHQSSARPTSRPAGR